MQIIEDKICEAFDFTTEDLEEKGWGEYVDKAVSLLSDEDTIAQVMAQAILKKAGEDRPLNMRGIEWCKANDVQTSIRTRVHMMVLPNWSPEAEINIVNMTFRIGTDDQMDVEKELVVEGTTVRYGATYWTHKNGDHVNMDFECHDIVYNRNGTVKSRVTVWLKNDQKPLEVEE